MALAAAALTRLPHATADNNPDQLLAPERAWTRSYQTLQRRLGHDDGTALVLLTDPQLMSVDGARRVLAVTRELAASGLVASVTSLATPPVVEASGRGPLGRPAIEPQRLYQTDWSALTARLLRDPLFARRLLSEDARSTVFVVRMQPYLRGVAHRRAFVDHIERLLAEHTGPGVEYHIAGIAPVRLSFPRLLRDDARRLAPVLAAALTLTLTLVRCSWVGILVLLTCVGLTELLTFAAMPLARLPLTPVGIALPVVIAVATSASCLHTIDRYARELVRRGDKRRALVATSTACDASLSASIATTIAFLAPIATGIPALRDAALIAAVGVMLAFLTSNTLAPALLVLLPAPRQPITAGLERALPHTVVSRPYAIVACSAALLAAIVAVGVPRLSIESKVVVDLPATDPLTASRALFAQRMGGDLPETLLLYAPPDTESLVSPDFLATAHRLQHEMLTWGDGAVVSSAVSLVDLLAAASADGQLPRDADQIDRALDVLGDDLLARWVLADGHALRIDLRVHDVGAHRYAEFGSHLRHLASQEGARVDARGFVTMVHRANRTAVRASIDGFGYGVVALTVAVALMLTSLRLAAVASVSLAMAGALTLAAFGVAGLELHVSSCVVFPTLLVFAIDDTVRFMWRYRIAVAGRPSPREALVETLEATSPPVLTTALLGLAFIVLLLGRYGALRTAGVAAAFCAPIALLSALVVAPALLVLVSGLKLGRVRSGG